MINIGAAKPGLTDKRQEAAKTTTHTIIIITYNMKKEM